MYIGLALLTVLCIVVIIAGCRKQETISAEEIITGGTKDKSNYNAPKEIQSEELVLFETEFYRYGGLVYDEDREYRFKMIKSEDDQFIISEGYDEKLSCETDSSFATKLNNIIKEYNLVKFNGTDTETYGLPDEYRPYWLKADYASDEKLFFSMDGDPNEEWTGEVLNLFAMEFSKHGIDDLLPEKEESDISSFSMEFTFKDVRYSFGDVLVSDDEGEFGNKDLVKKIYSDIWDRNGNKLTDDMYADITEKYYREIKEIAETTALYKFQNGSIFPPEFDYDNMPQYYEFYIEYESGRHICGYSDDTEQCEKFRPIAAEFLHYFDEYFNR